MAASAPASDIDNILECPLCVHQLNIPTTLKQCFHSYCKSCIKAVPQKLNDKKHGKFCPRCNVFATVDEIKHNFFIENLISIHNQHSKQILKCEQCKTDENVTWMCIECKISLCNICQLLHSNIPLLKGHSIVPLNDQSLKIVDHLIFCPVHEQELLKFNCETCEQLLCISCKVWDHGGHATESVQKALDRLLPELTDNTNRVKNSITQMEAQMKGLDKEIKQVQESYTACRLSMDNTLEQTISILRVNNAKIEANLIKQETIAINKLRKLQKDLECKIITSKQITSYVNTCMTHAKETSLLSEIQGGLFKKVKQQSQIQVEHIDFKIPIAEFEKKITNLKKNLLEIGSPDITDYNGIIDTAGNFWVDDQYICQNFNDIFGNPLEKKNEFELEEVWHNRITFINEKIWAPAANKFGIEIFTQGGVLDKTLKTKQKRVTVVKKTHNGNIIAGGDGLHVTNTGCTEWNKIADGAFTDIVVHGTKLSALNIQEPACVLTFSLKGKLPAGDKPTWQVENTLSLDGDMKINSNSTLGFSNNHYVITSHTGRSVYIFTLNNPPIKTHSKLLDWIPHVCGADSAGNILLCNFSQGKLNVLDPVSGDITELVHIGVKLEEIRDVVIDTDNHIWCLQGNSNNSKLVKYINSGQKK